SQCIRNIRNRKGAFHEPTEAPPGFGDAPVLWRFGYGGGPKAPEDWRTPRRYRAVHRFKVPLLGIEVVGVLRGAAGILPAEESERSSADDTSAARCWRPSLARSSRTTRVERIAYFIRLKFCWRICQSFSPLTLS